MHCLGWCPTVDGRNPALAGMKQTPVNDLGGGFKYFFRFHHFYPEPWGNDLI